MIGHGLSPRRKKLFPLRFREPFFENSRKLRIQKLLPPFPVQTRLRWALPGAAGRSFFPASKASLFTAGEIKSRSKTFLRTISDPLGSPSAHASQNIILSEITRHCKHFLAETSSFQPAPSPVRHSAGLIAAYHAAQHDHLSGRSADHRSASACVPIRRALLGATESEEGNVPRSCHSALKFRQTISRRRSCISIQRADKRKYDGIPITAH